MIFNSVKFGHAQPVIEKIKNVLKILNDETAFPFSLQKIYFCFCIFEWYYLNRNKIN